MTIKYRASIDDSQSIVALFFETIFYFLIIFILWTELNVTLLRFQDIENGIAGIVDDFLLFVYFFGLVLLSFQIPNNKYSYLYFTSKNYKIDFENDKFSMIIAVIMCIATLLILHSFYYKQIHAAKHYTLRRIKSYSFALGCLTVALIFDQLKSTELIKSSQMNPYIVSSHGSGLYIDVFQIIALLLIVIGMSGVFYVTLVSFRVHPCARDITNPKCKFFRSVSTDLFSLRFGILVMVVTGESILAILIDPDADNVERYTCVFVAFTLIYIVQQTYFGTYAADTEHALHCIFNPGSVAWVFSHFPLSFGLLGVGM